MAEEPIDPRVLAAEARIRHTPPRTVEPPLLDTWPPRDASGMVHPRRFTILPMFRMFPWLYKHFDGEVPDDFQAQDVDEAGYPIAILACPCGGEPTVRLGGLTECECGRFFAHFGKVIKVAKPPTEDSDPAAT